MSLRSLLVYSGGNAAGLALVSSSWLVLGADSAASIAVWYMVGGLLSNLLFAWLTWRGKK